MDATTLGKRIKQFRATHKLTQEKLAELINIDTRQVARLESGESLPSLLTFIKLCENFNTEPNILLSNKKINETKSDIYAMLSVAKPDQLQLIKKLIVAILYT